MADISITATAVLASSSATVDTGKFGATIAQGKAVYKDANGNFQLSDSNGTAPANTISGITANSGASGQPAQVITKDPALISGGTLTAGDTIFLSDTPGGMTATYSDIASGSTVIVLGVVNTDLSLNFSPIVGGTK